MLRKPFVSILIAILLTLSLMATIATAAPEVPSAPDGRSCGSKYIPRSGVQVEGMNPISNTLLGDWWEITPNSTGYVTFSRQIFAVTQVIFHPATETAQATVSYGVTETHTIIPNNANIVSVASGSITKKVKISPPSNITLNIALCDISNYSFFPLINH